MYQDELQKNSNQFSDVMASDNGVIENVAPIEDQSDSLQIGIVTHCSRLNIRKEPTIKAAIVCEIDSNAELMVDQKESTEDFYKVCTATGIEGFCMKQFISVQL